MRASLYLIGFAAASLLGAGVAGVGCSSSSSPPATTPPEDASTPIDSGVTPPEDTGTATDAPATPCTPISDASAATIVTGSPLWDCYEAKCGPSLTACAADCNCNNQVLEALNCVATDGGNSTTCFATVSTNSANDTVESTMLNVPRCECHVHERHGGRRRYRGRHDDARGGPRRRRRRLIDARVMSHEGCFAPLMIALW